MYSNKYSPAAHKHRPRTGRLHAVLLTLLFSQPGMAAPPDIRIVSSSDTGLYMRFQSAFRSAWSHPGNATLPETVYLADGQLNGSSLPPDTDLVVTVGTRAAQAVAALGMDVPALQTIIPESAHRSLAKTQAECRRQTAVYIDQPISRQLELGKLMFPQLEKPGLLLGPVSIMRRPEAESAGTAGNLELTIGEVDRDGSTMSAGRELLGASELFIAINDPLVLNRENAKWLLYVAYQNRIPVIGFSRAYVKAGAAAAVYSEPEQIARQAAELAQGWLESGDECLPPAEFPRYFRVTVNRAVSRSLGSDMDDEQELHRLLKSEEHP